MSKKLKNKASQPPTHQGANESISKPDHLEGLPRKNDKSSSIIQATVQKASGSDPTVPIIIKKDSAADKSATGSSNIVPPALPLKTGTKMMSWVDVVSQNLPQIPKIVSTRKAIDLTSGGGQILEGIADYNSPLNEHHGGESENLGLGENLKQTVVSTSNERGNERDPISMNLKDQISKDHWGKASNGSDFKESIVGVDKLPSADSTTAASQNEQKLPIPAALKPAPIAPWANFIPTPLKLVETAHHPSPPPPPPSTVPSVTTESQSKKAPRTRNRGNNTQQKQDKQPEKSSTAPPAPVKEKPPPPPAPRAPWASLTEKKLLDKDSATSTVGKEHFAAPNSLSAIISEEQRKSKCREEHKNNIKTFDTVPPQKSEQKYQASPRIGGYSFEAVSVTSDKTSAKIEADSKPLGKGKHGTTGETSGEIVHNTRQEVAKQQSEVSAPASFQEVSQRALDTATSNTSNGRNFQTNK